MSLNGLKDTYIFGIGLELLFVWNIIASVIVQTLYRGRKSEKRLNLRHTRET